MSASPEARRQAPAVETRPAALDDIVCAVACPALSGEVAIKIGDRYSSRQSRLTTRARR